MQSREPQPLQIWLKVDAHWQLRRGETAVKHAIRSMFIVDKLSKMFHDNYAFVYSCKLAAYFQNDTSILSPHTYRPIARFPDLPVYSSVSEF